DLASLLLKQFGEAPLQSHYRRASAAASFRQSVWYSWVRCAWQNLSVKPVRAGISHINPFPATQQKLKRLFPTKAASANASDLAKTISPTSPGPMPKPIPSPLRAAQDGFAGYF